MDNGTMVEAFKFLNYCQLATSSHVSKKFRNLIRTHRHKLALLNVSCHMSRPFLNQDPAFIIQMFNKEFSPEEYNEWIVRNGYSKQVPLEGQIVEKGSTQNGCKFYELLAEAHQNPNDFHDITTVFVANVELTHTTWPVFQHFIRLLVDPFIYIGFLELIPQIEILNLLAGAMNPDRVRLQCGQLNIRFNDDTHKLIVWIKDHVRCDLMLLDSVSNSNHCEDVLDLFLTGTSCTSAIHVENRDRSKVIVDLVQKFMGLKNRDEYQVVESIRGKVEDRGVQVVKRDFAEFIAAEEQYEERIGMRQVIAFINNDIEKKFTLSVMKYSNIHSNFSVKITNL